MPPPEPPETSAALFRYLPALDGLRALSVLSVIGFHAELPHFDGGFLGVEVFFVVSGYLITSLLLAEQRRSGRISLPQFWRRRARRLLPALFSLLIATLALSMTVAKGSVAETRGDALAALVYSSNWWQVHCHRSYFMAIDRPPLLLHLWSLAVEEQFYLGWPLAVALLGQKARAWVLPCSLLGCAASALWMARLFDPSLDPTRVYVGTDTRLSGLLAGAALAACLRAPLGSGAETRAGTDLVREVLSVLGLLGLGFLLSTFRGHDPRVFRGGLLLVDLASCALVAGLVRPTLVARIFGARPWAWLGRRSYGLYLWHWPIFAVTRPEFDLALNGTALLCLRLALTFSASELCYRFVEMPIRNAALPRFYRRPLALAMCAALLSALVVSQFAASDARAATARARTRPSAGGGTSPTHAAATEARFVAASPAPEPAPEAAIRTGVPLDPSWPKTLTLLTDSVGLGLRQALPAALPDWKVEILGRPALMVKQVVPEFLNARSVGSVVVVALAYNSLFERDRQNYARWSTLWDRSAERLLADLKACGAHKLVWITLREPSIELVTDAGRDQYERYAWFFPYVNERIRALQSRHPDLSLADWQAVSNVPGLTKDLIHLSPAGASLMTETVVRAVLGPDLPGRATP